MESQPQLIGLYSSNPQCGKSLVAGILNRRYGYKIIRFADTIKKMTSVFLEALGVPEDCLKECVDGRFKESPIPGFEYITPRRVMQTLGTEWGRDILSSNIWVRIVSNQLYLAKANNEKVVVDDVRFLNEAIMLQNQGGKIVRVYRDTPHNQLLPLHKSEGQLNDFDFDYEVDNSDSFDFLEDQLELLVTGMI